MRALRRHAVVMRRHGLSTDLLVTGVLVVLSAFVALGMVIGTEWVPPSLFILIELLGGFVLRFRAMVVLCVAIVLEIAVMELTRVGDIRPGSLLVHGVATVSVLLFVRNRDRRGLQGAATDLMLVDLRDRLEAHGTIPELPPRWKVESAVRSAHAEAFSGDFVVAARSGNGSLLEIALVDVSGKGQDAGVRSLLLSGAFGGLLGAMPPGEFLSAANRYLLGQQWDEGFATAVHVAVHLETGAFAIATAGHPPAVHLHAGSGKLEVLDAAPGPALGVMSDWSFPAQTGWLDPGDSLMLYTDGLVEVPGDDVEFGIDRLMGVAERVVTTRSGGVEAVLADMRASDNDDRALVLVHRD